MVKLRPTKNCLIAITEFPFFVIDVADIEAVHFERVTFGIKNFDMAIIFKDFTTFKRINSIPMEQIETIKEYLDEIGIIYSEGAIAMNWPNLLTQIRNDFESFLEANGWRFLQDEDDDAGEEGEAELEDEDESFDVDDDEEGEEESESDFSEDDDEDYSSSSLGSEEELSEEGLSWEEMDRRAEEEDRKNASRRAAKEPPQSATAQKRKPAPPTSRR